MDNINKELNMSLSIIQSLGLTATRDAQAYGYKYANLKQIWDLLRAPLEENGLLVQQFPDGASLVTCVVHVETGQELISRMDLLTSVESKNHMQDLGGAVTYARRYALTSMFNIIVDDDDNCSNTTDTPVAVVKPSGSVQNPATANQLKLISDLLKRKGYDDEKISARLLLVETSAEASTMINEIMKSK